MPRAIKVSVIIKALNEESNIERAIESSLAAVAPFEGEVILADSGSTDNTIEIARKFPITIIQLCHPRERCCGIGPQLGYQASRGEYVYILDGDMKLESAFIAFAIDFLNRERSYAGIGGLVRETRIHNLEFEARVRRFNEQRTNVTTEVPSLSGGGLYRRAAVEHVGYISDRNLHGYEEYDLGARLRTRGWRLVRSEIHAADHYSHPMNTLRLLWYRIRAGYTLSSGELLRAAIAGDYVTKVFSELRALRIAIGLWAYWALLLPILLLMPTQTWSLFFLLVAALLPVAAMTIRTRSLMLGAYSVLLWYVNAVGFVFGFFRTRTAPTARIEARTIQLADSVQIISSNTRNP
jgi:glycosyltransferase involved in cell wall biosynthesis